MKHLLLLACMIGVLIAFDAYYFDGRYRTDIWRQTKYQGAMFSQEVDRKLKEVLR